MFSQTVSKKKKGTESAFLLDKILCPRSDLKVLALIVWQFNSSFCLETLAWVIDALNQMLSYVVYLYKH